MLFMHNWRTYRLKGQSNVTIQEQLHMNVTNQFNKILGHFGLIKKQTTVGVLKVTEGL